MISRPPLDTIKGILMGVAWVVIAVLMWNELVGWPLDEFRLIRGASTAPGHIVDAWEEAESGLEGGTAWEHSATYRFSLPDGRVVDAQVSARPGRLNAGVGPGTPIEVEYLPNDPDINRIKGSGESSLLGWVVIKLGLGTLLLIMFAAPGVIVIRSEIRDWAQTDHAAPLYPAPTQLISREEYTAMLVEMDPDTDQAEADMLYDEYVAEETTAQNGAPQDGGSPSHS